MNVPANDPIFSGLDPQQSEVVRHMSGPALVVAGAGAGKTTTLVRRTAHLIRSGVAPGSILLLTFTRAAAKSIMDKARSYAPEADRVEGGTFHSIASRVIRENHSMFGLPPNFTILDPEDVEATFKRLAGEQRMRGAAPRASTIAKIVSYSINTKRHIHDVILDRFTKWEPYAADIEEISQAYVTYKKGRALLDFDDLLLFLSAMANHPAAGPLLRKRFAFVMVDEVQDLNALQVDICHGLGADGGNVMAVGDPSQSIYGFRGSEPGIMFGFRDHWPSMRTYLIETNYRSTPEIVSCADTIDRSMRQRFDRVLRARKPSEGIRPTLLETQDKPSEAALIADFVIDKREEGIPYKEQAVIARSMRNLRHVEFELIARGIPLVVRGGVRIHEAKHIKDVLAPLKIAANLRDEPAWVRMLTTLPKIGEKTAAEVAGEMLGCADLDAAIEALSRRALKKTGLAMAPEILRAASCSERPGIALGAVRNAMEPSLAARYEDEWDWRKKDIDSIVEIAEGYVSVEEFLRTLTIDVSIDKRAEFMDSDRDEEGVVTLSTVHSAKGLEWKAVYVPSFVEGHMPSLHAEPGEQDEEKRLFYVAVTRAKSELYLVRPKTGIVKGGPAFLNSSPYEHLIRQHTEIRRANVPTPRPLGESAAGILISVR